MVSLPREEWRGVKTTSHLEPRNLTMAKRLIIDAAPTGAFIMREQNPHQPYTPEEVARAAIECYRAGASVWHVHVRDEEGVPVTDPAVIQRTEDMVMDECPDIITSNNLGTGQYEKGALGRIRPLVDALAKAGKGSGRKYIQTGIVILVGGEKLPVGLRELQEIMPYLQANGIKPELRIQDHLSLHRVENGLIRTGILQKPYVMNVVMGFHGREFAAYTAPTIWGQIYLINMLQLMPEGSVIGVTVGGRDWLPLTVQAITLGADYVRVGMEDSIFMYPHKDEKIRSCVEQVKKVATIARELGREIATPKEARSILGLGP